MRNIFAFILLILLPNALSAQIGTDTARVSKDPGFLLTSLSYTTNNNSSRLANSIRMPALMANLSYYSNIGLYGSVDYFKYIAPDTNTFEAEFNLGYARTFLDNIDLDVSYTNRQFRGDQAYQGISYNHALELSGSYRLKNFSATVDNSFMIGETKNYFLDLSLSYDISFDRFLLKSGYLAISPSISGSFGTNFWLPATIDRTWGHHGGMGHPPPFVPARNFDYQSFSLILPVQYTLGHFTLSCAGFYAIPSKLLKSHLWTNQSGFLVSLSYALTL